MRLWLLGILGGWLWGRAWQIRRLIRVGRGKDARRLYRRVSWGAGIGAWCAMVMQAWALWRSGLLTWQSGLPLHLCSAMGVLLLPMLLTENQALWHASVYAGMSGAVLALLFPAMQGTAFPRITALGFYGLHTLLLLAPMLPLALGKQLRPEGILQAGAFLLVLGGMAMAVNAKTGGNYLFLSGAVAGTPLVALSRWGVGVYRGVLAAICALILTVEGGIVGLIRRVECS